MVIGIIMIVLALGLTAYNWYQSYNAGKSAQEAVDEIDEQLPEQKEPVFGMIDDMKTITINGNEYIGKISIPSVGINLPVMAEWDYSKLEISPCRYTGSCYKDDMVIAGHNYRTHFAPLKGVGINADVYFTTVDGYVFHYIVDNVETLQPTQVEDLVEADCDLTLFTCNIGGRTRCTVRCIRSK